MCFWFGFGLCAEDITRNEIVEANHLKSTIEEGRFPHIVEQLEIFTDDLSISISNFTNIGRKIQYEKECNF